MVKAERSTGSARARKIGAHVDAILLRRFPGRTLEELDNMDWMRFSRALKAESIIAVESQRTAWSRKEVKTLEPDVWELIKEHDELMDEFYADEQEEDTQDDE